MSGSFLGRESVSPYSQLFNIHGMLYICAGGSVVDVWMRPPAPFIAPLQTIFSFYTLTTNICYTADHVPGSYMRTFCCCRWTVGRWLVLFGGGCNAPSTYIYTSICMTVMIHTYMLRVCIGRMYVIATACQVFACDV